MYIHIFANLVDLATQIACPDIDGKFFRDTLVVHVEVDRDIVGGLLVDQ